MRSALVLACALVALAGCGRQGGPSVEDLSAGRKLPSYQLATLRGARDGDRLAAQAMFTDSSNKLTMDLHFRIGSPSTLESGTWQFERNNQVSGGAIAARSVTFLGGQDGPPSVGGDFDLLGPDGAPRYRVTIPIRQLSRPR